MLTNIHNSKIIIHTIMVLIIIATFTASCSSLELKPNVEIDPADIMYLVPADETKIEELVKPERLLANQQKLSIGTTSDWEIINRLASEEKTQAVIIHHAAIEQANQTELEHLFKQERFIVAGIGIPGGELAEMVGMPDIYNEQLGCCYKTPTYFYLYSYRIDGTPEDIATREAPNYNNEPGLIKGQLNVEKRSNTDVLTDDNSIQTMLTQIEDHTWANQRNLP